MRVGLLGGDDRRPRRRGDDLAAVLPLPADSAGPEHPPQRCRGPSAAGGGADAARVEVGRQRAQRLAGQQPVGEFADDRRFGFADGHAVSLEPERAGAAAARPAVMGEFLRLAPQPARHVIRALGGHGAHDPRVEAPVVRREVNVAGDGRERDAAGAVAHVEELFELARLAMQPVEMPDDDRVHGAVGDVGEHSSIFGARLAVVGADVVVDVALGDRPAALGGELFAVGDLAAYAERVPVAVFGDAGVDTGTLAHAGDINGPWDGQA